MGFRNDFFQSGSNDKSFRPSQRSTRGKSFKMGSEYPEMRHIEFITYNLVFRYLIFSFNYKYDSVILRFITSIRLAWVIWFNGISTLDGYLMPNPIYTYLWLCLVWFYGILTIVRYFIPNLFLYIQIVLFQTIHFSISTVFCLHAVKCQNSSISNNSVSYKYAA